jgi:hypothetical protein
MKLGTDAGEATQHGLARLAHCLLPPNGSPK